MERIELERLAGTGLAVLPAAITNEDLALFRSELLTLAIGDPDRSLRFGPRQIREEATFVTLPETLRDSIRTYAAFLEDALGIRFNEYMAIRFPDWSAGIEPHFEYSRITGVQALLCVSGGVVYKLEDPEECRAIGPGDILLRAYPGFAETKRRQHSFSAVTGETLLISLRQTQ